VFFDPTAEHVAFGSLPHQLRGQHALVCDSLDAALLPLPEGARPRVHRSTRVDASLSPDGDLHAAVRVVERSAGITRQALADRHRDEAHSVEEFQAKMRQWLPEAIVSNMQFETLDDSVQFTFDLDARAYAQAFGSDWIVPALVVKPATPGRLLSDARAYPVDFGPARIEDVSVHWTIPDALRAVEIPPELQASCTAGELTAGFRLLEHDIVLEASCTYTGVPMPASEYDAAQKFDRELSHFTHLTLLLDASRLQNGQ
jgi:hypothetical protein